MGNDADNFFVKRENNPGWCGWCGGAPLFPSPFVASKNFCVLCFLRKNIGGKDTRKMLAKMTRRFIFNYIFSKIQFSFSEFIDDDRRASEIGPEEDEDDEDVEDEEDTVDGLGQQVPAGDDKLVAVVRVLGGIGNYG